MMDIPFILTIVQTLSLLIIAGTLVSFAMVVSSRLSKIDELMSKIDRIVTKMENQKGIIDQIKDLFFGSLPAIMSVVGKFRLPDFGSKTEQPKE